MPLALDQGVGTVVWSPLSGGMLSGKIDRDHAAAEGTRTAIIGTGRSALDPEQFYDLIDALRDIAHEVERSIAQVALNWVLSRPSVSTIIIGARNEAQLLDNIGAANFSLTDDQVKRLDAASNRTPAYPYWHQRALFLERNPPPVA
jgi:aryl-alcohol dehydrogenase-like predicted oxidoreductase